MYKLEVCVTFFYTETNLAVIFSQCVVKDQQTGPIHDLISVVLQLEEQPLVENMVLFHDEGSGNTAVCPCSSV